MKLRFHTIQRRVLSLAALCLMLVPLAAANCGKAEKHVPARLESNLIQPHPALSRPDGAFNMAVGAILTPEKGFVYYRRLLGYIGERLGRPVKYVDRKSYSEINNLLESGYLDAAFVCSGPYVEGHDSFGLELLAVPQVNGRTTYSAYIIVRAGSPYHSLEDLRGKTFAFTDPQSNTGRLIPDFMLAQMNETAESFFSRTVYTYAHDLSISAVADGVVDGAAVDSIVWEYTRKVNPVLTSRTAVIQRSRSCGIPPVVVRPGLDNDTRSRLRSILLEMDETDAGKKILEGMGVDKFVAGDDSSYDSIRKMKSTRAGRGRVD